MTCLASVGEPPAFLLLARSFPRARGCAGMSGSSGGSMHSVSRWSGAGFTAAFVAVALSLCLYWPIGIAVGLVVGISLLAVIQRRLLEQDRADYLDERAEVEDLLGSLLPS